MKNKHFYIIFILILFSCQQNDKELNEIEKYKITYQLDIDKKQKLITLLNKQIEANLSDSKKLPEKIKLYHILTKKYIDFLNGITLKIKDEGNNILFNGYDLSEIGYELDQNTKNYNSSILDIVTDKSFVDRFNYKTQMKSIVNDDKIALSYLDYYFRGFPNIQSQFHLINLKKNILEFELEYIRFNKKSVANTM